MDFSKDWGSTTTWFAFAMLAASTGLVMSGHITATDWAIVNGISGVG